MRSQDGQGTIRRGPRRSTHALQHYTCPPLLPLNPNPLPPVLLGLVAELRHESKVVGGPLGRGQASVLADGLLVEELEKGVNRQGVSCMKAKRRKVETTKEEFRDRGRGGMIACFKAP